MEENMERINAVTFAPFCARGTFEKEETRQSLKLMKEKTGANYVIHLDPWWNPAIEQQATDRAYRIGQNQKVTVYHLIAEIPLRRRFCVCTKPNSRWRTRCSKERTCRTNAPYKPSWNCWAENHDA